MSARVLYSDICPVPFIESSVGLSSVKSSILIKAKGDIRRRNFSISGSLRPLRANAQTGGDIRSSIGSNGRLSFHQSCYPFRYLPRKAPFNRS